MELANKVAIVTGASIGIGRAAAIALAENGADVAINYRTHVEEAQQVAAEIVKLGRRAIIVQGDVSDQSAVEAMVAQTVAELGHLDIAVSNAAYSDRDSFTTCNMDGFRRTVDVTMWGAFYLLRAAANQMIKQGTGGSIVVNSSPHAVITAPHVMAYSMAKAAIDHMARIAAIELCPHKIRVNLMYPGWIDTPGERKFFSEETMNAAAQWLPWGRLGKPEEIARGIVFLASPKSDYVTGSTLTMDGGISLPWFNSLQNALNKRG